MVQTTEIKRLYKSRTERMIDGVCGGIAIYFNVDPTLVRIAWVLLTLLGGSGILLYIAAMIIIPKEPFVFQPPAAESGSSAAASVPNGTASSKKNSLFWGVLLIVVGLVLFLDNIGASFWHGWWWLDRGLVLSILLMLIGIAFMWGGRNSLSGAGTDNAQAAEASSESAATESAQPQAHASPRRLYRAYFDKKLFGVCGGIAQYFNIDSTIVRILFIVAILASSGLAIIAYVVCAIVVPREIPQFKL